MDKNTNVGGATVKAVTIDDAVRDTLRLYAEWAKVLGLSAGLILTMALFFDHGVGVWVTLAVAEMVVAVSAWFAWSVTSRVRHPDRYLPRTR